MAGKNQITGGAFQDFEGNVLAYGHLTMQLSHDGQESVDPGQVVGGLPVVIPLDQLGNIAGTVLIWPNDQLVPANSFYIVNAFRRDGQIAWLSPQNFAIPSAPSPYNIGAAIPTLPPVPGVGGTTGITLQTNEVNNGSQALLDLHAGSNVTLTDNGLGRVTVAAGAGLALQTNGTPNSSQALLNLANGSGVTITEAAGTVTVNAPGSSFPTAGTGWFSPTQYMPFTPSTAQAVAPVVSSGSPGANTIGVVQVLLPYTVTIRAVGVYVVTGGGIGNSATAIYDSTGNNKLVDAGANAFNTHTASQVLRTVTLGSPVTLAPGVYWWATASTDGAGSVFGYISYQFTAPVMNGNGVTRYGTAANALSAGAMPSSLGAITPFGTVSALNLPFYLFYT